jgi:hypothetical protein
MTAQVPSMTILIVNGVNPLQTTLLELGIVSGRVALLLRSAEIQPVFGRFVRLRGSLAFSIPPFPLSHLHSRGTRRLAEFHNSPGPPGVVPAPATPTGASRFR